MNLIMYALNLKIGVDIICFLVQDIVYSLIFITAYDFIYLHTIIVVNCFIYNYLEFYTEIITVC